MKKSHGTLGGVTVQVKGKNLPVTVALRDQVVAKMKRLDRYLDRLTTIEIELSTEKTRDAGHHNHVEATTHVAGRTMRVCTDGSDMYAAIDEAVDKLYRQLNRTKERMKSHHATKLADSLPPAESDTTDSYDVSEPIIHVERLSVKPQFEDEAIEAMDEQGRSFFVFLNARNEQLNVLYRREDGSFGLIEPQS